MAGSRTFVLLLGAATLSACSPYVYNPEITAFSTGVDAVVASFQAGRQSVDTMVVQQRQMAAITARARLLLLPGCDEIDPSGTPPTLPDCAVVPFDATSAPAPSAAQKNLADAAPAFNALEAYAAALKSVTAAADEAALTQAVQSLATAADGMAGTAQKLAPAAGQAGSLVTPAGSLIGQAFTIYLDQRRFAALRSAVPAMDPAVRVLGQTVQAALIDIRTRQLLQVESDLRRDARPLETPAVSMLSTGDYQGKLDTLESRIAAFNQARAADPAATVAAMVSAHHDLAQALQAGSGQGIAVLTSMQTFVATAEQLKAATVVAAGTAAKAPAAKE